MAGKEKCATEFRGAFFVSVHQFGADKVTIIVVIDAGTGGEDKDFIVFCYVHVVMIVRQLLHECDFVFPSGIIRVYVHDGLLRNGEFAFGEDLPAGGCITER